MSRRDGRNVPFLAYIDDPAGQEVGNEGGRCRFRGWIASGRGRPTRVVARMAGNEAVAFEARDARPDVVETLRDDYPISEPCCGFEFALVVPVPTPEDLTVTLELTDGEFVAQPAPYKVIYRSGPGPARADYKTVWDAASEDLSRAKLAVTGYTDEEEYRRTGEQTVAMLRRTVGIGSDEVILEIGAGVGRVGAVLAPLCKRWIGTDVSANMLRHAADRLAALGNVDLVTTNGWDLNEIPSESVDVAYCTVVFMHLDEWDRFNYVREGFRILRPGGRMYVDNFNLLGDEGWQFFVQHADNLHPLDRPPNISKSSTPEELRTYFERAGFADVHVDGSEWWVVGYGTKPD